MYHNAKPLEQVPLFSMFHFFISTCGACDVGFAVNRFL